MTVIDERPFDSLASTPLPLTGVGHGYNALNRIRRDSPNVAIQCTSCDVPNRLCWWSVSGPRGVPFSGNAYSTLAIGQNTQPTGGAIRRCQ